MAKRGAEAVACRAPWETFAPHPPAKRARGEPGPKEPPCGKAPWGGGGCKKRKRAGEEGETPAKRRGRPEGPAPPASSSVWEGTRKRRQEQPGLLPGSDEEAGSGGAPKHPWSPKASMAAEHEDDVWHYNSFQYWRPPLPAIELSDILNLEKENMVKTRHSNSAGLSEMET
uniref:uncharacterized protein C9orf40 homolog n=1 Tax=Euleptes europaea TaxID=460621 RepID=UPI0025402540|nr:uncharacterized protein C9orf40 homolog [Euleptes europaea]